MRTPQRVLTIMALALLVPVFALADAPADGDNRQLLDKMKASDPQHYARLRHNLAVFRNLPTARQETLRKLDRDLQEETTTTRQRLERVMERYAEWLERLPEAERQSIVQAPDRKTRLQRIHDIRAKQWVKRFPKAQADRIAKLPEAERPELIKKLRQEELEERLDWQAAQRHWKAALANPGALPTKLDMLSEEAREAFEKSLKPLLSRDEEKLLKEAEGKWPRFPRTVVELADNHPLTLQGPVGPTTIKELPPKLVAFLENEKGFKPFYNRLKEAEGKWPEFGVALRDLARSPFMRKMFPVAHQLLPVKSTPSQPQDFAPIVQQFIEKKLIPALDDNEAARLKKTESQWPGYPQLVLELARWHNLAVPTGPTRFDGLDAYRTRPIYGLTNPPPRRGDLFLQFP
jgi:hypothetical protein